MHLTINFVKKPGVKILHLHNNYRSRPHIVQAANHIIRKNQERLEKTSVPIREPSAGMINYHRALTPYEEAEFTASLIKNQIKKQGYHYKDFAVLYRTNAQSKMFEEVLNRHNIPCRVSGRMGFYEKKEVKDAIGYFKLLTNNRDLLAFQRVANSPNRKLGDASLQKIVNYAYENNLNLLDIPSFIDKIPRVQKIAKENLVLLISRIQQYTPLIETPNASILRNYLYDVGLIDSLDEERLLTLNDLLLSISAWLQEDSEKTLADCIRELSLLTDDEDDENSDRVTLASVHASKGLEYRCVFIAGVEEKLFPHFASGTPKGLEEERRLFYVAMTRAMDILVLTGVKERGGFGKTFPVNESRFLRELPETQMRRI